MTQSCQPPDKLRGCTTVETVIWHTPSPSAARCAGAVAGMRVCRRIAGGCGSERHGTAARGNRRGPASVTQGCVYARLTGCVLGLGRLRRCRWRMFLRRPAWRNRHGATGRRRLHAVRSGAELRRLPALICLKLAFARDGCVTAPASLRNWITTKPSAGSNRKLGLVIGDGAGAASTWGGDSRAVAIGGSVPLSLPMRATARGWTERSCVMAEIDRWILRRSGTRELRIMHQTS